MKKKIINIIIIAIILIGGATAYYYVNNMPGALPSFITQTKSDKYVIKKSTEVIDYAPTLEEAITRAKEVKRGVAINTINGEWVYSTLSPFLIITETAIHDFDTFDEVYSYAKRNEVDKIYYKSDQEVIWEKEAQLSMTEPLKVPLIMQLPELPRGCEVTSLAMIFSYYGNNISKLTLAEEIKKDTTPYQNKGNRIYYGNPYDGFVGNMYDRSKNGYGVYHGPIAELASVYYEDKVIDLTGLEFDEVLYFVMKGNPLWVITNATYKYLDDSYFKIWHTPTGIVKTTTKQHSVVITGFDDKYIYINDPLYGKSNRPLDKGQFKKAWEQMGNQAVVILNL